MASVGSTVVRYYFAFADLISSCPRLSLQIAQFWAELNPPNV